MTNLEKTWSLTSKKKRSQLQQQRHWRTSSCSSHRERFITKTENLKKYTALNWNGLSRSWKNLQVPRLSSIISSIRSNEYVFSSQRRWCWTMTTLRRGVVARFVCSLPTRRVAGLGLIYSATLERQHKQSGSIYHGAQRVTSKQMLGSTAKGKKSRLSYIT